MVKVNNNVVVNFGHWLSESSVEWLKQNLGPDFGYAHVRLKIDFNSPLKDQITDSVTEVESALEKQGRMLERSNVFIVTPGLSDPSVLLVVEIFGRTGTFPNVLLLQRDKEQGEYVIYGYVDCEKLKNAARGRRRVQVLEIPNGEKASRPQP